MPRLGPRQQSVVIAAATVLLLLLTLILINADSIRSSKVVQRLSRTKQGSAGLSFSHQLQGLRSSLLSTQPSSRKLTVAGTSGTSEERGDHETDPRALDYSRLRQLPEKEPIDTASLGGGVITWMQEAEDMIVAEIEKVQFPASCSEAKWLAVPMHMGGLMSDVHLFQASLVFGVSHGYTVVPLPNSHLVAFAGCIEKSLHCFFQPVTNCSFYDSPRRVAFYREASIGAPRFPAGRRRGAFAEREIPEALARGEMPGDVIAVPIWPCELGYAPFCSALEAYQGSA